MRRMHKVLLSLFLASQLGSVAIAASPRGDRKSGKTATAAKAKVTAKAKGPTAEEIARAKKQAEEDKRPPTLDNTFGYEGNPHLMSAGHPDLPQIIFLHGAGQETNNELIGRVVGALRKQGVKNDVVSLPWESNLRMFQRWIEAQPGPFILSGHSAGGALARELTERYPEKFKAVFLINPATRIKDLKVPTLLVRGTEDFASGKEGGENVTVLNPLHADHSLRYHPGRESGYRLMAFKKDLKKDLKKAEKAGRDEKVTQLRLELDGMRDKEELFGRFAMMEKDAIAKLPETEQMNREVAGEIEKFLGSHGIAH
jgi:predicted esterase